MSFLNGGLLWLTAAATIPIIIHLLHRSRFIKIRWAATNFLKKAIKKTRKKIRLENLILLLLRILIVTLLALAVAKPVLQHSLIGAAFSVPTSYYVIVDNSLSMNYKYGTQTLLEKAKTISSELLAKINMKSEDRLTVITFNKYPKTYPDFIRKEGAKELIQNIQPTEFEGDALATFTELSQSLKKSTHTMRKIYLITDLQVSNWKSADIDSKALGGLLKDLSHDQKNSFSILDVGENRENCSITSLTPLDNYILKGSRSLFTATVFNFSKNRPASKEISFYVNSSKVTSQNIVIEPLKANTATFDYTFTQSGYASMHCSLDNDFLSLDDNRYLSVKIHENIKMLVINGEPAPGWNDEASFLKEVLTSEDEISIFSLSVSTPIEFNESDLHKYDMVFILNTNHIPTKKVLAISEYIENGGSVFISVGSNCNADTYNKFFGQILPGEMSENIDCKDDCFISTVSDQMGLLSDRKIDLTNISFKKIQGIKPQKGAKNLLEVVYNGNKLPLLVLQEKGLGKIVLYTTTIDDEWSRFCFNPLYALFIYNTIEVLMSKPFTTLTHQLGDTVKIVLPRELFDQEYIVNFKNTKYHVSPISNSPSNQYIYLFFPEEPPDSKEKDRSINYGLSNSGFYSVAKKSSPVQNILQFSVNLPPRIPEFDLMLYSESNLEKIEDMKQLFPEFRFHQEGKEEGTHAQPIQATILWKPLLYAVFVLMVLEFLFASYLDKKKSL
ncbi:MAG: BatA domain-containing protein [Planctomycetes bacterium]|nr:BatA domain-containing protein [Planctomycetota bacterium]